MSQVEDESVAKHPSERPGRITGRSGRREGERETPTLLHQTDARVLTEIR